MHVRKRQKPCYQSMLRSKSTAFNQPRHSISQGSSPVNNSPLNPDIRAGIEGNVSLSELSESLGGSQAFKRPSRARKAPQMYNDQDYNKKNKGKRGEKPASGLVAELSEDINLSSLEDNISGAARAKGKQGRKPGKRAVKSTLQQFSDVEMESEMPSSKAETEVYQPLKPIAKQNGKRGRKVHGRFSSIMDTNVFYLEALQPVGACLQSI